MNFLSRIYLKIKYPDVCWKHRRMMSSHTYGYWCPDCSAETDEDCKRKTDERHRVLKERYGVKHGL